MIVGHPKIHSLLDKGVTYPSQHEDNDQSYVYLFLKLGVLVPKSSGYIYVLVMVGASRASDHYQCNYPITSEN